MARILSEIRQKDGILMHPPLFAPISSFPSTPYHRQDSFSSSISPVLLLVITVLALVIVFLGILHLLFKFLIKTPAFSQIYQSIRNPDDPSASPHGLQSQLQQLFHLHDSGLDQAAIDALPVFYYKDIIMGLKEPFDCAVCLSEFSDMDKLRLLPACSHAFHVCCIETWLLSNSTCPLCRGTLLSPNPSFDPSMFRFESCRVFSDAEGVSSSEQMEGSKVLGPKRVLSVRLGKFRSINEREMGQSQSQNQNQGEETTSECGLGTRRCYSMGTYEYLVCEQDLLVALSPPDGKTGNISSVGRGKLVKANSTVNGDFEDKRISGRCRGESFSVSKIWLWSKKNNRLLPTSSINPPFVPPPPPPPPPPPSSVVTLSCNDRTNTRLKE